MNLDLKPCYNCPHRKTYEGGVMEHEHALRGKGRFAETAHPCHNAPTTPCQGHLRDLEMVANNEADYSGDTVENTYRLTDANGNTVQVGEFTHLEILAFRNGVHQTQQHEPVENNEQASGS